MFILMFLVVVTKQKGVRLFFPIMLNLNSKYCSLTSADTRVLYKIICIRRVQWLSTLK